MEMEKTELLRKYEMVVIVDAKLNAEEKDTIPSENAFIFLGSESLDINYYCTRLLTIF